MFSLVQNKQPDLTVNIKEIHKQRLALLENSTWLVRRGIKF